MTAYKGGDMAGVAAMYTSQAMFMAPNMPIIEGREDIQHYLEIVEKSGISQIRLKNSKIDLHTARAVETGNYELIVNKDVLVDRGKYLVEWIREGDEWFMHKDIFNSDLPAPRVVAQQGQGVSVIVHKVKHDRRKDYEDLVRNIFLPTIDQSKPILNLAVAYTRFLIPEEPEVDGSYWYVLVMDPVIEGVDYSIENMMIAKFGAEEGFSIITDLYSMMAAPYDKIEAQQTEF